MVPPGTAEQSHGWRESEHGPGVLPLLGLRVGHLGSQGFTFRG